MTLETLSRWWDPISLKGKLVSHSIRLAVCFVIWNYLPNVFDIHDWYHSAIQFALVYPILPPWARTLVKLTLSFLFAMFAASLDEKEIDYTPHDAIKGDPGPAWSEWHEPGDYTRFMRD